MEVNITKVPDLTKSTKVISIIIISSSSSSSSSSIITFVLIQEIGFTE